MTSAVIVVLSIAFGATPLQRAPRGNAEAPLFAVEEDGQFVSPGENTISISRRPFKLIFLLPADDATVLVNVTTVPTVFNAAVAKAPLDKWFQLGGGLAEGLFNYEAPSSTIRLPGPGQHLQAAEPNQRDMTDDRSHDV